MPACCLLPVAPSGIRSWISSSCPRSGLDAERMTRGGSLRHWALPNVMQGTAVGAPRQTPQFHLFSSISVLSSTHGWGGTTVLYRSSMGPRAESPCTMRLRLIVRDSLAARGNANCSPPTNIQPDEQPQATRRAGATTTSDHGFRYHTTHAPQADANLIRIQPRRQCRPLICPACWGYVVCVSTHCQHDRMMGDPQYMIISRRMHNILKSQVGSVPLGCSTKACALSAILYIPT
ncbi:hypothetical protein V8C44DRAFT_299894 [Trichoderma aethiopicum]